jgi:hypothetical protein
MAGYDQGDADLTILVEADATAESHHGYWMSSITGLQDILFLLAHKVKIIVNIINTIAATGHNLNVIQREHNEAISCWDTTRDIVHLVNEMVSLTSSGLNMATLQNPLDTPPYWYQQKTLTKRTGMRIS